MEYNPNHETVPSPVLSLAIASVLIQPWEQPYEPGEGLARGTIFPCLDMPFFAGGKAHE